MDNHYVITIQELGSGCAPCNPKCEGNGRTRETKKGVAAQELREKALEKKPFTF